MTIQSWNFQYIWNFHLEVCFQKEYTVWFPICKIPGNAKTVMEADMVAWGQKGQEELKRNVRKCWGDRYIHYLDDGNSFMVHNFIHTSKYIKLYILNMYSLLYVNYTPTKILKS